MQRLLSGKLLQQGICLIAQLTTQTDAFGQLTHDFDALDGIDGQIRFQIELGIEHIHGIPRALADNGKKRVTNIQRCSICCIFNSRIRRRCRCSRESRWSRHRNASLNGTLRKWGRTRRTK